MIAFKGRFQPSSGCSRDQTSLHPKSNFPEYDTSRNKEEDDGPIAAPLAIPNPKSKIQNQKSPSSSINIHIGVRGTILRTPDEKFCLMIN